MSANIVIHISIVRRYRGSLTVADTGGFVEEIAWLAA